MAKCEVYKKNCSSWNKSYIDEKDGTVMITLCDNRENNYDDFILDIDAKKDIMLKQFFLKEKRNIIKKLRRIK